MKTKLELMKRMAFPGLAFAGLLTLPVVASRLPAAPPEPAKKSIEIVDATHQLETEFPYVIDFETYHVTWGQISRGDEITITSVRGDRPHIAEGGRYLVEGT